MDVRQQTINGNLTKIDKEPRKVINSSYTPEQWKKVHWKFKQKERLYFYMDWARYWYEKLLIEREKEKRMLPNC